MSTDRSATLDSTHVVVPTSNGDADANATATRAAVLALLDHAARTDLRVDRDALDAPVDA